MPDELAKTEQKMTFTMAINSRGYQKMINTALGGNQDRVARFTSAVTSAVTTNPQLNLCNPSTILSAALLGESLGLSPSPQLGQYYMVPFDNVLKDEKGRPLKDANGNPIKEKQATFQLGYKGYVQLALRSGYYKRLNVMSLKAGELKRYDPLTEEIEIQLMPDELEREKAPSIGYVAMFEYTNGFRKVLYWSREKMEAHALRYSKGYAAKKGYTFWEKDFDAMAFKTMLRQLISKWGIMSIDLQTAFEQDSITADEPQEFVEVGTLQPVLQAPEEQPEAPEEPPVEAPVATGLDDL